MKYCKVLFVVVNQFVWNVHFSKLVKNDMVCANTFYVFFLYRIFVALNTVFSMIIIKNSVFLVCMSQDG